MGDCVIWEGAEREIHGIHLAESTEYICELKKNTGLNKNYRIQYIIPRGLSEIEYQALYKRGTTVFNDEDFLSKYNEIQRKNMERWTHYEIVNRSINGLRKFNVKDIESFKDNPIPPIPDRAFNVLDFFYSKIKPEFGEFVEIKNNYIFLLECLSYSDSSANNFASLPEILEYLKQKKFIEIYNEHGAERNLVRIVNDFPEKSNSIRKAFYCEYFLKITVFGYEHVRERNLNLKLNSNKVFIAIWSDEDFLSQYGEVFKKAVRGANEALEPYILAGDYKSNEKICEKALIEIQKSSLVIVDLTCPKAKASDEYIARGSVYFEAGYAKALKRDVIWTAREDMREHIHFDVEHYPILFWKNEIDLENKLKIRVEANVPPRNSF